VSQFVPNNVKEVIHVIVKTVAVVIAIIVVIPAFYVFCNMWKVFGVDVVNLCQLVVIFLFAIMMWATLADLGNIKRFIDSLVSRCDW
jgi:Mg2+/citrate symporter